MGVSDMAPACQLCGGKFGKGTMASACLSVWEEAVPQFLPWCQTLQFLPVATGAFSSCYPGAGAQREWVWLGESMCGLFKRNCLGLQKFIPLTQSPLAFAARSWEYLSSWHRNPGLGAWCGAGTPHAWDIPPEVLFTTRGCGTSLFHVSALPTSLDRCGFCNSVVVRVQFNSISDGSEWWFQTVDETQENTMGQLMAIGSCARSQGAYFEGDWGIIVLCTVFPVFLIFFNKCLYFS